MVVIGLTGGIATGKSTLAHALRTLGAPVLDADAFSRQATAENGKALPAILAQFGQAVFEAPGRLDRRALGELVFSDAKARRALESMVHPIVNHEISQALAHLKNEGAPAAVLDVPLLYEAGMEALADEVWVAYLPLELQVERLMARDRMSHAQAMLRIESQMPMAEKLRRADIILPTTGARAQSAEMIREQWLRVLQKEARDHD